MKYLDFHLKKKLIRQTSFLQKSTPSKSPGLLGLTLRRKSPLQGLILVCPFYWFWEKIPPCTFIPSIFCKFKPLDSKESAVFFKTRLFFLIQLYKYTLFQCKRASFKVTVLFYLRLSVIFQKISPCTFNAFQEFSLHV